MIFKPLGADGKFKPVPKTLTAAVNATPAPGWQKGYNDHEAAFAGSIHKAAEQSLNVVAEKVQVRLELIKAETEDLICLREAQLENRRGAEVSEAQIDMLRGQVTALEKRLEFSKALSEERRKLLLSGILKGTKRAPDHIWHMFVRFVSTPG